MTSSGTLHAVLIVSDRKINEELNKCGEGYYHGQKPGHPFILKNMLKIGFFIQKN